MRVRKIHIETKNLGDTLKETGAVYEAVAGNRHVKKKSAVYFSTLEDVRKALTCRRMALLKVVKEKKPSSVYELSKMTGRNLKNVLQDVSYLERLGIVDVVDSGDKKIPQVHYDMISFDIAI